MHLNLVRTEKDPNNYHRLLCISSSDCTTAFYFKILLGNWIGEELFSPHRSQ